MLVGFHERKSRYIADMQSCAVLPPQVSALLMPLRELVMSMQARDTLPQIELAMGDEVIALVLRHLEPLSDEDQQRLRDFGHAHGVQWWLQPKGPDTVHLLDDGGPELAYALPEYGVTMPFKPTDFTQVNPHINRVLVHRAVSLLDVQRDERVIDWFCGLGNFTLPLATQAREVLGIEGSETLVQRARDNALRNDVEARFAVRNLFELTPDELMADGTAQKWLVDPPREGAFALAKATADLLQTGAAWTPPSRIVYVSCNPATLARDAGCWCTRLATAARRPARSTCSRTRRTWRAWRSSSGRQRATCIEARWGRWRELPRIRGTPRIGDGQQACGCNHRLQALRSCAGQAKERRVQNHCRCFRGALRTCMARIGNASAVDRGRGPGARGLRRRRRHVRARAGRARGSPPRRSRNPRRDAGRR